MSERSELQREIDKRRTFAIISHPDAGKTTLTEKLLLYGGVVHLAGAVKAKRGRANAVSDWMEMERERGISITTSVLQFEYKGLQLNLLDTPGHADFSEDTYRTLHAVDGAVMLLDAAKGVESQTRKLFRVCRQRSIPIFTFVNKMDRPGRDPFELIGEVESVLGIGVVPLTWPVFRSGLFLGVYHRTLDKLMLFDESRAGSSATQGAMVVPMNVGDLDDPRLRAQIGQDGCEQLEQDIDLLNAAGDAFDPSSFLQGRLSPMFFGSAINNFGLETFLDSFIQMMPPPGPRASSIGLVDPGRQEFTGFVFKVQANMNPAHRDRVAFVRICSGQFHRKTKVLHVRTDREVRLANPTQFIAKERTIVEEAYAGDVIGVYDPGFFQVGDTLTGGTKLEFEPIPSFAPEYFKRLVMVDPLRRKQLVRGTTQLAQEGTVQLYQPPDIRTGDMILGAVGLLQLEVVKHRLASEYGVDVRLESVPFHLARWVTRTDGQPVDLSHVRQQIDAMLVVDVRDRPVVLFEAEWNLNSAVKFHPEYQFAETAQGVIVRDPQND
ncbi:MAG TPA: peptide chain release factor 3 [Polyangiaceae bacterium]|jgi:peptide chain release factor 3|nr:MAG: Peptide chain release factor 3 [Deltaproteobacteria bacterium ADurb.Bin207]HNS98499.1 peptide chain release factor 3 [Polyangiaceae bacterium]HNZ23955.1 peptide chain release factor 3 [Polyangiaceae bacterium]HOD21794.1 peptide chain release factor 3 [Polyangiaceae bacterium]HOE49504.1 peptide chain release factor 3 [Polyangiaceae bacterium]